MEKRENLKKIKIFWRRQSDSKVKYRKKNMEEGNTKKKKKKKVSLIRNGEHFSTDLWRQIYLF